MLRGPASREKIDDCWAPDRPGGFCRDIVPIVAAPAVLARGELIFDASQPPLRARVNFVRVGMQRRFVARVPKEHGLSVVKPALPNEIDQGAHRATRVNRSHQHAFSARRRANCFALQVSHHAVSLALIIIVQMEIVSSQADVDVEQGGGLIGNLA